MQAALSIAAVDEMIFALHPEDPVSERAYFLIQEELLKSEYQDQARTILMSGKPSDPLVAGYLMENMLNRSSLHVQASSRYADREDQLINRKIAIDHDLFICFLMLLVALLLFFSIPLLKISMNAGRENYWVVVEKSCWKDIQRKLRCFQLLFTAPVIIALILSIVISNCSTATYASIIKYKLNFVIIILLFAGFMLMLIYFFKSRNRIFYYLDRSKITDAQKVILLIPWIYAVYIFVSFSFLLSVILFPNTDGIAYLAVLFMIFLLFPAVSISRIRYVFCVKEDFDLRCQSRFTLGSGLGRQPGRYSVLWMVTALFYAGPFTIVYIIFVLMIIAMFMPFTKTIDKLGKGDGPSWSGGSGGYYYSGSSDSYVKPEVFFEKMQENPLLNLNGEQLVKTELPYIRRFFPETLYWQPQLITDEQGRAAISFNVADTITNYRFSTSAISRIGKLDSVQQELKVYQDFFVDFNPPENFICGDIISIPVVLYNYMKEPQQLSVAVQADKAFSIIAPIAPVMLAPRSVTKYYLKVKFERAAETKMLLTAIGKNCKDAIERTIKIVPNGRKETVIINDVLQNSAQYKITVPDQALPDGRDFFMKIYPTPLPQIADTLKGMLREPYGCFEQTVSVTYPNIFIFKYLDSTRQFTVERKKQTLEYISQGYQRLLTFESSSGGFSWYGNRQTDIRLSAYGLMLLSDMETVLPIDKKVADRIAERLESLQNPDGSWTLPYGKSSVLANTAFVLMALNKAGCREYNLSKAARYIIEQSGSCKDPYALALCANALLKINRKQAAAILERLYEMRKENNEQDTWWESSGQGVFYSCDNDIKVGTTALIANAMLTTGQYPATLKRAVIWLYRQGLDRCYSGHTLVQIMRTLIDYDLALPKNKADTPFDLSANLNGTAQSVVINNKSINLLQYLPFKQDLHDGENTLTVNGDISVMMGFQGIATYYLPHPAKTQKITSPSTLELSVAYSKNSLLVGDTTTCKIYLKNKGAGSAPMGIITMPVPPGFEVVSASLEEMVRKAVIDKFEIGANRLILYFREFATGSPLLLSIDLKAVYPAEITAPALTAYPYYDPDNTAFSIPEKLIVIQADTGVK